MPSKSEEGENVSLPVSLLKIGAPPARGIRTYVSLSPSESKARKLRLTIAPLLLR